MTFPQWVVEKTKRRLDELNPMNGCPSCGDTECYATGRIDPNQVKCCKCGCIYYLKNDTMPEEKTCKFCDDKINFATPFWQFCPMCGKPLKEKEWEPEHFKNYYSITPRMEVEKISVDPFIFNKPDLVRGLRLRHAVGNLFTSREAAEKHLSMIKCVDSQRELPTDNSRVLFMDFSGTIEDTTYIKDGSERFMDILWRLGFAQPDTPEGRALLEKNIREHKEWFE